MEVAANFILLIEALFLIVLIRVSNISEESDQPIVYAFAFTIACAILSYFFSLDEEVGYQTFWIPAGVLLIITYLFFRILVMLRGSFYYIALIAGFALVMFCSDFSKIRSLPSGFKSGGKVEEGF